MAECPNTSDRARLFLEAVSLLDERLDMSDGFPWKDPLIITIATAVIAFAAIVNLLVSVLMWLATNRSAKITEKIFEAAHRPYLGIVREDVVKNDREMTTTIRAVVKNSGGVLARDIRHDWKILIDGKVTSMPSSEEPAVLVPEAEMTFAGEIDVSSKEYSSILSGEAKLLSTFNLRYKGVTQKEYHYATKREYDHTVDKLIIIEDKAD